MTTIKNNIAESCLAYYDSDDFKANYAAALFESFNDNKDDMLNIIIYLFNVSNYETQKDLPNWKVITREQAKEIFEFINVNFENFTTSFNGYYVGYTSLYSVEYGEQEEQLTDIHNHNTGKTYSAKYLRRIFDNAGYVINDSNPDYAYYIVSGGLHIDLLQGKELLNQFLTTI